MTSYPKKLNTFKLLSVFTFLILFSLPIRPAFSGNTLSVDSIQGPSFTLYYDLISGMGSSQLWFTATSNSSMNTTISTNPFLIFGNLKECEFDLEGNLIVLNSGGFSFDVFAISLSRSNITLRSVSIPTGSTFVLVKEDIANVAIGHFSWDSPPQDQINLAAFEATVGTAKIGKKNQRILKIYNYGNSQSLFSSSVNRTKIAKSNALSFNYSKGATAFTIPPEEEMNSIYYYDLSVNAYGGVYVLADLDYSYIPSNVHPLDVNFDGFSGGTQPNLPYNTLMVYKGKTLAFNVSASNSGDPTQALTLKKFYLPEGAQFVDPPATKEGDASAAFQWPVGANVADGIYTAIFGAYLSSGSNYLFPTLLLMNIKVQNEPPAIGSDQTSLPFNGTVGGSNPASKILSVNNTGGGTLNWTASKTQNWLTLTPTSGSSTGPGDPNQITVSVDISGLSGATYNDTITISGEGASNTPLTIPVSLTLTAPAIGLDKQNISFGGTVGGANPGSQTLSLSNSGPVGTTLNWTAAKSDTSWLSITPSSGQCAGPGDPKSITVSATVGSLAAGIYNGTITISDPNASNNPRTVQITLTILAPAIGLDKQSISFSGTVGGANPGSQTLSVSNSGPGGTTLNWAAQASTSSGGSWLSITPSSGQCAGPGDPKSITVSAAVGSLAAGTYNGTMTLSDPNASNNPQTVQITLTILAPAIGLDKQSISFSGTAGGANPGSQTLSVSNSGPVGTTLNWTAAKSDTSWLSITPSSGQCAGPGDPKSITVSATVGSLAAGTYNGTMTISDPNASNSPRTVNVSFTVNVSATSPRIGVDPPDLIAFDNTQVGSTPAPKSLQISNQSGGTLNWSITKPSWVNLSLTSGLLTMGKTSSIEVSANTTGLSAGTYTGGIVVSAPGASNTPKTVSVTLTLTGVVTASPKIGMDPPDLIAFDNTPVGSTPAPKSLQISNQGGGTLNWSISSKPSWVNLSLTSGQLAMGQTSSIEVSVDTTGLSAGPHTGGIVVSAPGASNTPKTVSVTLTLTRTTPEIGVIPGSLSFTYYIGGTTPASQNLSVYNAGGGTLNWNATAQVSTPAGGSWLSITPASGSITVSVNVNGLAPATSPYTGTITISDNGSTDSGGNSSPAAAKMVNVTLQINTPAPPSLGLAPDPRIRIGNGITFPGNGEPAALYIWNKGTGAMSWTATPNASASWLTVTPSAGTTNAEALESGLQRRDKVRVSANTTGLSPGKYQSSITVTALGGSEEVEVTLYVNPGSSAGWFISSASTLIFSKDSGGSDPAGRTFRIQNNGASSISWTASSDQPWLGISPAGETLAAGAWRNVTVTVSPSLLSGGSTGVGTYDGYIKFDAPGADGVPYYLHAIMKIHQKGWDFPSQDQFPEFIPTLPVTSLENLFRPDYSWYGIMGASCATGETKYYSTDPTSFIKSKLHFQTSPYGSSGTADIFVIRRGWGSWQPSPYNGQGTLDHQMGQQVPWDSENERYYFKVQCTAGGSYWIMWETED